jgi:hypothetical protein
MEVALMAKADHEVITDMNAELHEYARTVNEAHQSMTPEQWFEYCRQLDELAGVVPPDPVVEPPGTQE